MFDMIGVDTKKPISSYTYEANKDLKVLSGEKAVNYLLETYGDTKLRNDYNIFKEYGTLSRGNDPIKTKINVENMTVSDFVDTTANTVAQGFGRILKDNVDNISKDLISKGYDAIVDLEDQLRFADYPVILLNPEESIKMISEHKW